MTDDALTAGETRESLNVAQLVEQLRLAEAKLARQRQSASGLNDTDRAAVRFILEYSDSASPMTPSVLAAALHLTPPAMTSVVDRLIKGGFITVTPHPTDRRKKVIEPFDRTIDPDHVDPLTTRIRGIAATLAPEHAVIVAGFLQQVLAAVSDPDAPAPGA
ncbi:MarR family transcriptional regulator [Microbacterium sp. cx-55]|uniref:MarR family winged helix-turn-helix transcriptional regulator n=1 Tax=Microbacterium sp. cx-55 TaxID=2875948 RepID=UPI001CBF6653|nr:MarR family transcriptional regulator [Microbacterium sp. cx-55]MBZ4486874.1 MarR family transcriptional regulator [Microbacterium sp. cx-55]UGB35799.1 MarR family transcriptional regulator [Microbacterium sp. cx-55]